MSLLAGLLAGKSLADVFHDVRLGPIESAWQLEPQLPKRLTHTGLPSAPSVDATMPVVATVE